MTTDRIAARNSAALIAASPRERTDGVRTRLVRTPAVPGAAAAASGVVLGKRPAT